MKTRTLLVLLGVVLATGQSAHASETIIHEYPDRIVVEIDGSMDPKLPSVQESQSARHAEPRQQVESSTSSPLPRESTAAPQTQPVAASSDVPYSRAETIKAYLAQLPNRRDAVQNRLEGRQMRWQNRFMSHTAVPSSQ